MVPEFFKRTGKIKKWKRNRETGSFFGGVYIGVRVLF